MAVDPAARELQLVLIVRSGQPGVRPAVDGGKVDVLQCVVAPKVTALGQSVVRVVRQQLCILSRGITDFDY